MSPTLARERERYKFVLQRDGKEAACAFARQAVRCYRAAVLDPTKYGMYKRQMTLAYVAWKKLIRLYCRPLTPCYTVW